MSPVWQTLATVVLLSLASDANAQESAPKPADVSRPADAREDRPPAKPEAAPKTTAGKKATAGEKIPAEHQTDAEPSARPDRAAKVEANAAGNADKPGRKAESKAKPLSKLPRETKQDYALCRLALAFLGTVYEERPRITEPDNAACGINKPLHVTEILPGVTLQGGAIMRCDTARTLGFWAQQFLLPASSNLSGAPRLTGLQLGTTYDCRARNKTGKTQPKLSEHALGNAIDITAFEFDDGKTLSIKPRDGAGDLPEAFQRAVRGSACLYFTTVLGPGSNAAHSDHLHLDVAKRNNDWRLCQ